jgi:hypothetical protein
VILVLRFYFILKKESARSPFVSTEVYEFGFALASCVPVMIRRINAPQGHLNYTHHKQVELTIRQKRF